MSTEIKGLYGSVIGISSGAGLGNVFVYLPNASATCKDAGAPRADFLAAVATECNVRISDATEPLATWELALLHPTAIVIDRAELPEVTYDRASVKVSGEKWAVGTAAHHRSAGLAHLAIAEYIDAHQPVDEAVVDQIRDIALAADVTLTGTQIDTIARYFAGKVTVTP